jgi:hypothetical protein
VTEAECWKAEADTLRRIVMEALAEREACGWQPIETAPTDGRTVLLFCPEYDMLLDRYGAGEWESHGPYEKEMGEAGAWLHFLEGKPTHWMPISPPREHQFAAEKRYAEVGSDHWTNRAREALGIAQS